MSRNGDRVACTADVASAREAMRVPILSPIAAKGAVRQRNPTNRYRRAASISIAAPLLAGCLAATPVHADDDDNDSGPTPTAAAQSSPPSASPGERAHHHAAATPAPTQRAEAPLRPLPVVVAAAPGPLPVVTPPANQRPEAAPAKPTSPPPAAAPVPAPIPAQLPPVAILPQPSTAGGGDRSSAQLLGAALVLALGFSLATLILLRRAR